MHDEAAILPSAVEADTQQPTPADLPPEHGPLPTRMPLPPETRAISQPLPARPSSRFSTVMGTHSRQTFIIDISDDEEDEEEEESVHDAFDTGSYNSIDSSDFPLLESIRAHQSSAEQPPTTLQSVGSVDTDMSRPQCEHDVDPPFMTDGRGRVVWSSTRNASGRGTATEGRAPRQSRTGSTPRIVRPSASSALLASNTRGNA